MKRCKICHVEAELVDGRCRSCRMAKEATDHHMTYGKYVAMTEPPTPPVVRNKRMPETKKCPWCGAEFIPVRSSQVYCCTTCAQSANYDNRRDEILAKAKAKTRPTPKICVECGRKYIPQREDPRLKYCSPRCCATANVRLTAERRRAKREQEQLS